MCVEFSILSTEINIFFNAYVTNECFSHLVSKFELVTTHSISITMLLSKQQVTSKNLYQITVGIFFIIAGIGKSLDSFSFSELIYSYGLQEFYYLSPILAVTEVAVGLALLLFIKSRFFLKLAFGLLLAFTIAFGYAYFYQGVENCGCLGTLLDTSLPPSISFLRNFLLLCMCLHLIYTTSVENTSPSAWKIYLFTSINLICLCISSYTFYFPNSFQEQQSIFEEKSINDTPLKNIIQTHQDSTYLVLVYTYQCPHCKTALKYLEDYQEKKIVDKIITISAETEDKIKSDFSKTTRNDFLNYEIDVQRFLVFGKQVPLTFYIKSNKIQMSKIGKLPSSFAFKKIYL